MNRPRPDDPLVGTTVEVDVDRVAHGGHFVARHEGRVLFVRHTLPGERVRARITGGREGDRSLRADAIEVLRAAPERIEPACRYAGPGACGGCDFQHIDLAAQRRLKAGIVREQLQRAAGLDLPVEIEPVPGDDAGLRWRTRVEFAVDRDGAPGLRPHRSRAVIPVDDCLIGAVPVIESGVLDRTWPGEQAVDVAASSTGQVAQVPVPSGEADAPLLTEEVATRSSGTLRLQVGARGFWQVHPGAAATFVDAVIDGLDPQPGQRAADLYCGVGLFAAALRPMLGSAGAVWGIEADGPAVRQAELNLPDAPGLAPFRVRRGRVDRALGSLPRAARPLDLVVLDPPRTGAGKAVVDQIVELAPSRIGYVACDPSALARDLATFAGRGYRVANLRAFDAFPMTHHIECVAILHRD